MAFQQDDGLVISGSERRDLPILGSVALAFRLFGRAPWQFIGLMVLPFLLGLIPALLVAMVRKEPWYPAAHAGALVVQYAIQFVASAALIHGGAALFREGRFDFEASIGAGFGRSIPVAVVTVLQVLAIVVGIMLFVVPGIIVALALAVALPATVVEARRPIDSLKRSVALTRGQRWRILGLGLLVLGSICLVVAGAFVGADLLGGGKAPLLLVAVPIFLVVMIVGAVLGVTLPTVLFLQLRALVSGDPLPDLPARQ